MRVQAAIACLMAAGLPAHAETLHDVLAEAYRFNPNLEAAHVNEKLAYEQLEFARAQGRVRVTTSSTLEYESVESNRLFAQGLGENLLFSAQVQATLPVYTGGQVSAGIDQARAGIDAASSELFTATQSVFLQTVDAYVTVLRDQEQVRIRRSNLAVLIDQVDAAEARFEVGDVTRTDVAQAVARRESAIAALATAEAALASSTADFVEVVGREPDDLVPPPPVPDLPASFEEAVEIAINGNPNISALQSRERAAQAGIKGAEAQLKPQVSIVGSASKQDTHWDNEFQDSTASIAGQVRFPLFQGGAVRSQVRQARLQRDRARLQTEATRNAVISTMARSWASYEAALRAIDASREAVAAAEIAFEGAEIELEVGLRTTLELLDQEQELLEARLAVVSAERDAYVAAHQILTLMGQMTPETLRVNVPLYNAQNYGRNLDRRWFWINLD